MTVKQLKEKIKDLPDNMDVFIEQTNDSFEVSLCQKAAVMDVTFTDDKVKAKDYCLVISDEI